MTAPFFLSNLLGCRVVASTKLSGEEHQKWGPHHILGLTPKRRQVGSVQSSLWPIGALHLSAACRELPTSVEKRGTGLTVIILQCGEEGKDVQKMLHRQTLSCQAACPLLSSSEPHGNHQEKLSSNFDRFSFISNNKCNLV